MALEEYTETWLMIWGGGLEVKFKRETYFSLYTFVHYLHFTFHCILLCTVCIFFCHVAHVTSKVKITKPLLLQRRENIGRTQLNRRGKGSQCWRQQEMGPKARRKDGPGAEKHRPTDDGREGREVGQDSRGEC